MYLETLNHILVKFFEVYKYNYLTELIITVLQ